MADDGSVNSSPTIKCRGPISSFFGSHRFFTGPVSMGFNEAESFITSPSSILDFTSFAAPKNPFLPGAKSPKRVNPWEKMGSRGAGIGLADILFDEKSHSNLLNRPAVLFGSQLKIQVPVPVSPPELPPSPGDFGIKTRPSGSLSLSSTPSPALKSPFGSFNSSAFSILSPSEMELSEDYTCVISYGPNPRTTHIFDDCIVESCCGVVKLSQSRKENGLLSHWPMSYPSESFLSFCYSCRKNLGQGTDIYMYRGEKAFCSSDCRYKEMMLEGDNDDDEEEMQNSFSGDSFSSSGQFS